MKTDLDFIVIGAAKAGTTSLFEYLRHHPSIQLPATKEASYFSHDSVVEDGWDAYLGRTFDSADPKRQWGTASPAYMAGGVLDQSLSRQAEHYDERTVPLRIYKQLPKVRLVAILRCPIERAFSHHRMATMNGAEHRPFDEAVAELTRPEMLKRSRQSPSDTTGYITWGEYGRILAGYLSVFPREQILIVFTDDLAHEPRQVLKKMCDFIGVTSEFKPKNLGKRYRVGASERRTDRVTPSKVQKIAEGNILARSIWHALPMSSQRRVEREFNRVSMRFDLWNRREEDTAHGISRATRSLLQQHYASDTERLEYEFGVHPPWQPDAEGRVPTNGPM